MHPNATFRFHRGAKGFVLITTALLMVMLIGMLGLCLDLSRMYIAKNELQAFSDAATLAAARHLDGTSTGITYARNAATSYPDEWYFQSAPPDTVTVTFAATPDGPWLADPPVATGIQYVHVVATGNMTLYFMPGFSVTAPTGAWMFTIARTQSITGDAISGEYLITGLRNGLVPYSPDAIVPADPNYGYTVGSQYTLRWPPPGQRKTNSCPGDQAAGYVTPRAAEERGFIDIGVNQQVGGGNGSAFIREAIVSSVQSHPLYKDDTIIPSPGNRGTESDALRERLNQDTDTSSTDYATYYDNFQNKRANGRRLIVVPINNPANNVVLGFGLFLLQPNACSDNNNAPCCATYVSNDADYPSSRGGSSTPGLHMLKLFK